VRQAERFVAEASLRGEQTVDSARRLAWIAINFYFVDKLQNLEMAGDKSAPRTMRILARKMLFLFCGPTIVNKEQAAVQGDLTLRTAA
jgi:hypothetical protein